MAADERLELRPGRRPPRGSRGPSAEPEPRPGHDCVVWVMSDWEHVTRRRETSSPCAPIVSFASVRLELVQLNVARLRRLVDEARANEPVRRAELLDEALSLWRGEPLAEFRY